MSACITGWAHSKFGVNSEQTSENMIADVVEKAIEHAEISPKEIVGVDIDPICIFRSTAMSNNNKYIWLNMNTTWNISSQIEYFGQIWEHTQLFKYNN